MAITMTTELDVLRTDDVFLENEVLASAATTELWVRRLPASLG